MKDDAPRTTGHLLDPVRVKQRINSIDILRGVALLGILLMNIAGMALPDPAYWDPSGYGGDSGWNLRVFFVNSLLFEGTMRGIFAMLFGAGVILFTGKKEEQGAGLELANAWYRRTIWLVVFGLVHAYLLIWPGEILYSYGIVGMFLFPARHAAPSRLIGFALFLFLVISAMNIVEAQKAQKLNERAEKARAIRQRGGRLTEDQSYYLEAWAEKESEYKPDRQTKERRVRLMRSGYFQAVRTMAPFSRYMQTSFFFRYGFLDVLSMMLLGMGLFKLRVFHAGLKPVVYVWMILAGYGIGIPVNWLETSSYIRENFSIVSYFNNQQTYELGRITTTMGHVGLVMLFAGSPVPGFLKRALSAVGRMALTNYIMHTVIATTIFGIFRQYGQWQRYELYFLVAGIWIFQLIASPVWLRHFRFGPMEWLWRWLTYKKRPSWKR